MAHVHTHHNFAHIALFRLTPVKNSNGIRTGRHTESASDAAFVVNQYQSISSFKSCSNGTNGNTGRLVAMHTGSRHPIRSRILRFLHFMNFKPSIVTGYKLSVWEAFSNIELVRMAHFSDLGFYDLNNFR